MKPFRRSILILCGILGFFVGLLIFLPFDAVCDYLMVKVLGRAAENGIYASVQYHSAEGIFNKEFVCRGIQADFPVFRFSSSEVRIAPSFIRSLLSGSRICTVSTGRGDMVSVMRQKLEWTEGKADVAVDDDKVSISNIELNGNFSVRGFIEFSAATGVMEHANLMIKVPGEMDRALQMLGSGGMIPISRIKEGEWKVEK
ncbi:MAG: hypothetical protein LLF78_06915 [Synergistaceae bacterium]|nr:hypothetical protein [Synergistaceae bacterium]